MEPDGDDFGPLYSDHVVKPCSLVQEAGFSNDQSPSKHCASSVFSANVVEGLREYDGFLLSQCGGGGESGADDVGMEENEGGFDGEGLDVDGKKGKMVDEKEVDVVAEMMDEDDVGFSAGDGDAQSFDVVCKGNEDGVEDFKGLGDDDVCVNEEESEGDESLDIIVEDSGLNEGCEGGDKKEVEIKEVGLADVMCKGNEDGVEDFKGLGDDDVCVNEEESEGDESLDIIVEDSGLNEGCEGGDKKEVEIKEVGLADVMCKGNEDGVEDFKGLGDDDVCVNEEESEGDESLDIIVEDSGLNEGCEGGDKKEVEIKEVGLADVMCKGNEDGVEDIKGLGNDEVYVNEDDSEGDESLDIIVEDSGLNDGCEGSDKKEVEIKEFGLKESNSIPEYLDDDLEPGEIPGMKMEFVDDVEARVGHSNQSSDEAFKGVRSVFTSQTIDKDSKGEQDQVEPVQNAANNYRVARFCDLQNQVNPVHNAAYNHGINRFRHLPEAYKKAFNLEDKYSRNKPWTRPGANLSDYFNFDLDEESWQNYCNQLKQLLQTSSPSKAVGNKSGQLQQSGEAKQVHVSSGEQVSCRQKHHQREHDSDVTIEIGEAIQVYISSVERVSCLENPHKRRCGSDAIIEIVCVDSADDTELFTKDLRDCALHEYKTRPTTIHKIINGDNILPFPLDGSFHQISDDERTSPWVMMNYALEGRWWREFELVVGKKKERFYNQERSVHLDYPKERTEAEQRLHGELVKCDKVQIRLENNRFHNSGRRSRRQGDSKYKRSSELPDESKPTANVYVNNEITKNRFDSSRMSIEETLSQTNYEGGSNDKLNKGCRVDKDNGNGMKIEEFLSQTDDREGNNDKKFNIGSADDKGNCRMRRKETLSQTEQQEGNNNKMLDLGSAVNEDTCRIRIGIDIKFDRLDRGSAVKEDTCRIRIAETLSQVDHQEGNDNKKFNMGSAVHEDNCGMIIEETLSQTDDQEGNNDKRLNKGRTVHEDFYSKQATKPIDNHEQEFPSNCNLASNSGNNVIFGDQKHEAERGKNVDKESEKMQGSPEARESPSEDMKELMSNIRNLMTEIDDLVRQHEHEHKICCLR